jgi:hypothetical protein
MVKDAASSCDGVGWWRMLLHLATKLTPKLFMVCANGVVMNLLFCAVQLWSSSDGTSTLTNYSPNLATVPVITVQCHAFTTIHVHLV